MNDPDDVEQSLVYADELSARGDPRGALIMLHARGLHEEAEAHLSEHAALLIPPFEVLQSSLAAVDWRLGFIRRLVVLGRGEDQAQNDALRGILEHDSLRFLSALELSAMWALAVASGLRAPLSHVEHLSIGLLDEQGVAQVVEALASRPRPLLSSLELGETPDEDLPPPPLSGPLVNKHALKAFAAATPALRALTLRGNRLFKGLVHHGLTHLTLIGEPLDGCWHDRHSVAVTLPNLTTLTIESQGARFGRAALLPERLPSLRTVIFRGDYSTEEHQHTLLATLATSAILPQLKRLEVPPLAQSDDRLVTQFAHLELKVGP